MAFPSDVLLPTNARYYNFVETKKNFNSNYDITWSFSYYFPASSIQSHNNYQLGFTTFLTTLSSPISALPGQYLGDQDPEYILSAAALLTETPEVLKTEGDSTILLESSILSGSLVKVAFDSTGFYALTGRDDRPGVGLETDCFREALVVRDFDHNVLANAPLSTMSTSFSTLSTNTFRTLRFRYINLGQKLHIDVRESDTTTYSSLTTINLNYRLNNVTNLDNIFVGFSLCTPISAATSTAGYALSAGDFYLRNFHIEGHEGDTVETETVATPLLSTVPNIPTTTVSNITA
jgi:hypothetical protein|tara:strand:+ start:433 stop:1308 length:876 start_codon:yes stop_codon:yes gene_type:complete